MTEEKKTDAAQSESQTISAKDSKKTEGAKPEALKPGMSVRVYQKIKELNSKGEEKERVQFYDGIIIAKKHGKEKGASITVRKVSDGVGVEKIFPLNLTSIDKIIIKKEAKVRRAKLYFLRDYKKKLKEVKTK